MRDRMHSTIKSMNINIERFTYFFLNRELVVPFPTVALAEVAYNTLSVDQEPRRGSTSKTIKVEENELKV